MLRRWKVLLLAIAAGGLVAWVVVAMLAREKEPTYGGKRLSEWVGIYSRGQHRLDGHGIAEKEAGANAIRQIGTNALPQLLAWMDDEPGGWLMKLNIVAYQLPETFREPLVSMLGVERRCERMDSAANCFAALGTLGSPAVTELAKRVSSASPRERAVALDALSFLGSDAVPSMMAVLSDRKQGWDMQDAMRSVYNMGTNAYSLIPLVAQHLRNTDLDVAMSAGSLLGFLNLRPEVSVPALTKALEDSRADVRMTAAQGLEQFGALANPSVAELRKLLDDTNAAVRQGATNALQTIAPEVLLSVRAR